MLDFSPKRFSHTSLDLMGIFYFFSFVAFSLVSVYSTFSKYSCDYYNPSQNISILNECIKDSLPFIYRIISSTEKKLNCRFGIIEI